jgi:hypothetical protein
MDSEIRGGEPCVNAVICATCRDFVGLIGLLPTDPMSQLVIRRFPGSVEDPGY